MSIAVHFLDEMNQVDKHTQNWCADLLQTAAKVVGLEQGEVSVSFVDNAQIQDLNRVYRTKDEPTDVLSFPMEEDDIPVQDGGDWTPLLGDIVISVPKAKEQAVEYGHSYDRELGFLLVHGFLHIMGFDHQDESSRKAMFAKQEEILLKHRLVR